MRFFPTPQRLRLDNGMEIYVVERPDQPSAEVQCHVRTGSIHEDEFLGCGLSHFLEHMLFQGCRDFPGTSVADFFNTTGGDINAYTSFDRTVYHATVPGQYAVDAVKALGSMVRYPEFPEQRFTAERDVILRECDRGNDNPHYRIFHRMQEMIFSRHPMAYPVIGNPLQIAEVTRERMVSYWERRYLPRRIFWVVVGAVNAAEIFDAVSAIAGDWQGALPRETVLPPLRERHALMMQEMHFADPLSRVAFGAPLPPLNDDRIPAMDLAISLAAGGDASMLVRKLRLERELATQFSDSSFGQPTCGMMLFFAAAPQKKIGTVTSVLRKTLAEMAKNGFSRHEITREKTIQFSEELQSLRENSEIALRLGDALHCGESPEWIDRMLQKRQSLTVDEVNETAAWLFDESRGSLLTQIPPEQTLRKTAVKQSGAAEYTAVTPEKNTVYRAARELPLCDFSIVLPGGVIFESPENAGATYLITQLLTAGSQGLAENAIADKLDSLGASLQMTGGNNSLSMRLTAPRKYFPKAMNLLGRMLQTPVFAPDAFAREQSAAIQNALSRRNEPGRAADAAVRKMLFGAHPYGRVATGNPEDFAALTPEKLRAYYHSLWQKDRVVLGFGGDLSEAESLQWAADLRDMLPWSNAIPALPDLPEFPQEIRRKTIPLPRAQSVVLLGMPMVTATCREWQIFLALNDAMNGLSSRLYQNIREKHALAYSVGMRLAGGYHPGYCTMVASTAPENADKVESLLLEELEYLRQNGISAEEWREAVQGTLLSIRQQLASPVAALSAATLDVYYGQKADRLNQELLFLQQLSPAESAKVIREHFSAVVPQIVRTMPEKNQKSCD